MKYCDTYLYLPFAEVESTIHRRHLRLTRRGTESEIRLLEYCLSFAEYQYGDIIPSKTYRERKGVKVNNWEVDIETLLYVCFLLAVAYEDGELRKEGKEKMDFTLKSIHYFEKSLCILEPWRVQLPLEQSKRTCALSDQRIDRLYVYLSDVEIRLGEIHLFLNHFDKAGDHLDKGISYAKKSSDRRAEN
jgi:hypothetical protein